MNWLYVLFTADILNIAISLPTFGAFVRSLGGTPFSIGLINSSTALVTLLWNPIVGSYSDQVGRKDILIKCLIASAAGTVIMALSSSLILLSLGRFIGAFGSPAGVLLKAIVGDKYKTAEEKKIFFDKCAPFLSVAFLGGSVAGGFLSELKNGFSISYLLMASISGLAAVVSSAKLSNDSKPITNEAKADNATSFISTASNRLKLAVADIKTISWPRYRNIFYIKGFYDFSIATIFSNVGLLLLYEYNVKGRVVGYVFMMTSICRITSNILKLKLKKVLSKIPDNQKIVAYGLVLFISYLVMGFSNSLGSFLTFLGVMCIARAFMDSTLTEIITTKTTQNDRGKVIGVYENLYSFSMFVAPLLSGVIAEAFGHRIPISLAAIPIAMTIFVASKQTQKTD